MQKRGKPLKWAQSIQTNIKSDRLNDAFLMFFSISVLSIQLIWTLWHEVDSSGESQVAHHNFYPSAPSVGSTQTDSQTHALWEPDVKSQDKSKIPDCAERCGAAVGENGMWAPCISVTLWDLTSLHSEYDYEKKCCSSLYISVEDERSMKMSVQTVLSFPKSEFQQLNGSFNNAPLT